MPSTRDVDPRDDIDDGRHETADERADRNWLDVLQELRVMQTGTQILTGFLLALAFQPAFADLSDGQRTLYLCLIVLSALSAIVALSPVVLHRFLFRRRAKARVVSFGHVALIMSLVTIAVLLIGVVAFVFDVVLDGAASWAVVAALSTVLIVLWVVTPIIIRIRHSEEDS